jgi:nicotinamidase-related amidase
VTRRARGWDAYLTDADRTVFERAGYGGSVGIGRRPALLVIDMNYAFCGREPLPILESVERWHNSCGPAAWEAIRAAVPLLDAARAAGLPVFHASGLECPVGGDVGLGRWRDTNRLEETDMTPEESRPVAALAPVGEEILIRRSKPSVFFGTELTSYLIDLGVDTVMVCGCTTSGCVRATVVDGFSLNFRMIVVEECTFDRAAAPHWVNLFDMHQKYADVLEVGELLEHPSFVPRPVELRPVAESASSRP